VEKIVFKPHLENLEKKLVDLIYLDGQIQQTQEKISNIMNTAILIPILKSGGM
jgi:hypothetical protein